MANPTMPLTIWMRDHLAQIVDGDIPNKHQIWMRAIRKEGIPGIQQIYGRWLADPDFTRDAALALGLKLKEGVKAPRRRVA